MNPMRYRIIKDGLEKKGPIVYWMCRDQRAEDNWALLFAQNIALNNKVPLIVVFCLVPEFLNASIRQYGFMLKGLKETQRKLENKEISFYLLTGYPYLVMPSFLVEHDVGVLVTDFSPLRTKRSWLGSLMEMINIPFYEVDSHNIVPCWAASPKQEYAAYTFRPKIRRLLSEFYDDYPPLKRHPHVLDEDTATNWDSIERGLQIDRQVPEVKWIKPGPQAAKNSLRRFLKEKLSQYDELRNDPNRDGQSNLSPYLHFGQLSAQRVALEVRKSAVDSSFKAAFLEELIVRRELSDNFCFYNQHYDSLKNIPNWAKKTLNDHRNDHRDHLYSLEEFEHANTHDSLWNAAQKEMVVKGKMHGYLRMYWAKKILEWTEFPEQALKVTIYLNDKYELDGRDPSGYTGIAWSIGGVHDRAWKEREIFGKVRYMSYRGMRLKFNVDSYVENVETQ